ncbi:hypothetical protein DUNSADRAFT_5593 [Dunaliella salina]|uniref:Uncharacterized protein n=1 Tax=Dunaliella salina TaxID=3046 RepID=A0ABQ7GPX7_DUNSA|nr:hypothetical protein DUNSADRAFT_5593 [Dunaliella salina]|eukprot:KAF5836667.1 hypothetical protein DUNSADRAFT_5593 [Dunaliella salina]
MKDVRSLQVLVKELGKRPKACSLDVPFGAAHDDLRSAVSNVVLGPEDERWTKVHEQTKEDLDPKHGGGTIHVTTKYEAQEVQLWTHPHDDCCPMQRVELKNLPPELDVYALLAGPAALNPSPLDDGPALRTWWASLPRGRYALRSCAERRLQAKASVPEVATLPVLKRKPKDPSFASATAAANQDGSSLGEGEGVENKEGGGSGEGEGTQHFAAPQQGGSDLGQQPESSAKDVASAGAIEAVAAGAGAKPEERGGKTARPLSPRRAPAGAASGKAPQEGQESMEGEIEGDAVVEEAKRTHVEMGPIQRVEEEVEAVMVEMEVPWNLRHDLMLESMQGLWEMATRDRPYSISFSPDTLAVLVHGLESGALEVMSIAAAAVWVVAAKADQRSALVQLGAVEALAGAALIGHTEREHLCRTKQEAAMVEAAHKNEAAAAAQAVAEKAETDAQKAIKWAARGIGGAAAEAAKDEAIAKAEAAKADAAAARAEADAAAEHAAEIARAAASAHSEEAEGVEGEHKEGHIKAGEVEWNEEKRAMLLLCNRVVYHCLGALGIMAVDQKARAMALQVSPTLNFLTHLAIAEFPPPPSLAPTISPVKPEDNPEQEQAEGIQSEEPAPLETNESPVEGKTPDKKMDQGPAAPSSEHTRKADDSAGNKDHAASNGVPAEEGDQSHGIKEGAEQEPEQEGDPANEGDRQSTEADNAENGEDGTAGSASDELMPEDDVLVQQKMAVEVLYAMLGRDRDVRASLAQNDGLKDLLELTRSHQQQETVEADDFKSEKSEIRQDLDPPHALISNEPFRG